MNKACMNKNNKIEWNQFYSLKKKSSLKYNSLIHCCLEIPKRVIGKQYRPRSDAAKRGVWSGSPLFANSLDIFLQEYHNLIAGCT